MKGLNKGANHPVDDHVYGQVRILLQKPLCKTLALAIDSANKDEV